MTFPSWMIPSLKPAISQCDQVEAIAPRMRHLGTTAYPRDDEPQLWAGQTTWAWEDGGLCHAVGWDWVEMQRDVIVLSDPMALITNVEFAAYGSDEHAARRGILLLNSLVYLLPWQDQVRSGLRLPQRKKSFRAGLVVPKSAHGAASNVPEMELAA